MISYTVKLVGDSTYLAKTLEVANNLLDNLVKKTQYTIEKT